MPDIPLPGIDLSSIPGIDFTGCRCAFTNIDIDINISMPDLSVEMPDLPDFPETEDEGDDEKEEQSENKDEAVEDRDEGEDEKEEGSEKKKKSEKREEAVKDGVKEAVTDDAADKATEADLAKQARDKALANSVKDAKGVKAKFLNKLRTTLVGSDKMHAAIDALSDKQIVEAIRSTEDFFLSRRRIEAFHGKPNGTIEKMMQRPDCATAAAVAGLCVPEATIQPYEAIEWNKKKYLKVSMQAVPHELDPEKDCCGCPVKPEDGKWEFFFLANQSVAVNRLFHYDRTGNPWAFERIKYGS